MKSFVLSPCQCHQNKFIPKTNCSLAFPELKAPLVSIRDENLCRPCPYLQEAACSVALSCPTLCDPIHCPCQAPLSIGFSRQEPWNGLLFPSQGIILTQGSNPHLLHQQVDSLPLHHLGNPFYSWKIRKRKNQARCFMLYPMNPNRPVR